MTVIDQITEAYKTRFISIADMQEFGGKPVVKTIKEVVVEKLEAVMFNGRKLPGGTKGILRFSDSSKEWILGVKGFRTLKAAFGKDEKQWVGKRVSMSLQRGDKGLEKVIIPFNAPVGESNPGVQAPREQGEEDLSFAGKIGG